MMKKIVITGGLGYIGTELCKIYSGEARFKNIVVLDNRFVSERVKQLRDWGIEFIQGSILDETLMKSVLSDCDVIHHLAGITDVAYVKTEVNSEQDKKIIETSIIGTNNVLKFSPPHCRIIFPSTHVVYEGFEETKYDISEEEPVCPILTYSTSKCKNETDIKSSGKDFIILRLGSVYGYSTDTMRINIMPNLFSKMASQNQNIKLFSKGIQYKSLVNLIDVARCFRFMETHNQKNETYHLVNEQCTVKQVAEICKKFNPNIELIDTNDEVPNLGYTLSNIKLLSTGFNFLFRLENSIQEMIENWSKKNIRQELEYIIKGDKEFIDDRGKISNFELTEPINLIGYIESKSGTVRANHYHPIQEQKCLLLKGKYISVIKDLSTNNSIVETRIINEGEIAVIKPNVAHTMVFLEDSIFLNLVRGEREHENYGITHTIPYKLVDDNFRDSLIKNYAKNCRVCSNSKLMDVVSLGLSPLANNLIELPNEEFEKFPLEMKYCPECHNCQLSYIVEPNKMFDNYLYVSSTTSSFRKHFEDAAEKYINKFKLDSSSKVLDIGSNDGIALKPLQNLGIKVLGVEPAKNISEIANNNGIETLNLYFDKKVSEKVLENHGTFNLITASNVFAHSDNLSEITDGVFNLLDENGYFIVEVQYLLNTIQDLTFDNIYHEHVNYWSLHSLIKFFQKHKMFVEDCELINTHGGSIRVYVSKKETTMSEFLKNQLVIEENYSLKDIETFKEFGKKIETSRVNVRKNIDKLKNTHKVIYGYGSPAKATTSLNYFGLTERDIQFIIEDNKLKIDKIVPGTNIPIKSKNFMEENLPDCVIVLAWNFFNLIVENNQDYIKRGVVFINIKDLEKPNFIL
jgi:nucleoside-diphosphate-sugar epimerase/2-polyprenyl-3-methyl-5-hydroxy-6-metoxy-1,4-benzoquinol methylase/quercetin dioxygenase-like cupin family protein